MCENHWNLTIIILQVVLESGTLDIGHVQYNNKVIMFAGINMFWARLRLILAGVWEGPKTYLCPRT